MKRIALMMFVVLFACSVTLIFAADQKGMSGIVIAKRVYNMIKNSDMVSIILPECFYRLVSNFV